MDTSEAKGQRAVETGRYEIRCRHSQSITMGRELIGCVDWKPIGKPRGSNTFNRYCICRGSYGSKEVELHAEALELKRSIQMASAGPRFSPQSIIFMRLASREGTASAVRARYKYPSRWPRQGRASASHLIFMRLASR
eukprot:scaffold4718_cov138-Skeletonema_marinoi.AAC.8